MTALPAKNGTGSPAPVDLAASNDLDMLDRSASRPCRGQAGKPLPMPLRRSPWECLRKGALYPSMSSGRWWGGIVAHALPTMRALRIHGWASGTVGISRPLLPAEPGTQAPPTDGYHHAENLFPHLIPPLWCPVVCRHAVDLTGWASPHALQIAPTRLTRVSSPVCSCKAVASGADVLQTSSGVAARSSPFDLSSCSSSRCFGTGPPLVDLPQQWRLRRRR